MNGTTRLGELVNQGGDNEKGWYFSNGSDWLDFKSAAGINHPTQLVGSRALEDLHGDYMAAWIDNDSWNTATGQYNEGTDAMSVLTDRLRQPHSWKFSNEPGKLDAVRGVGEYANQRLSGENTDSHTIDLIPNALIGAPAVITGG